MLTLIIYLLAVRMPTRCLAYVTTPFKNNYHNLNRCNIPCRSHHIIISDLETTETESTCDKKSDKWISRRHWATLVTLFPSLLIYPGTAHASTKESKLYTDPKGLFLLRIPQGYFIIRRETNGDDTTSSKPGSSILLTAGDLSKAQLISVERFPIAQLLQQQAGIPPQSVGWSKQTTLSDLGTSSAIVQLLVQRRDRDRLQQQQQPGSLTLTRFDQDSVRSSPDDHSISFQLMTDIPVQKPELLMEQYGVNQLVRVTLGKVSIASSDGFMMTVYASGLSQDLIRPDGTWTEDGQALQECIDSFTPSVIDLV